MADTSYINANNTSVEMSLLKNQSVLQGTPWQPPKMRNRENKLTHSQVAPINPQLQTIGQHLQHMQGDDEIDYYYGNGELKLPQLVAAVD